MARIFWAALLVGIMAQGLGGCADEDASLGPGGLGATSSALTKGAGGSNGATDYCNDPLFPCTIGQGDCDSHEQCTGPADTIVVCGTDNGPRFGMGTIWDVCWPAHCESGVQDGDEIAVDCGGSCGCTELCRTGKNGDTDFCAQCTCLAGEGDCDEDSECLGELVCGQDIGPRFGMKEFWDVCWPAHCENGVQDGDELGVDCGGACGCTDLCNPGTNGDTDYCVRCRCRSGEGDCDSDAECLGDLVCGQDNGPLFGMGAIWDVCWPAHCQNGIQDGDETGVDCGGSCGCSPQCHPGTNGDMDYCARCACRAGEGDCDADAECLGPLVCGTDNGPRFGFDSTWDVCWPSHCENGIQDGDETGVDCGGSCGCSDQCRQGKNGDQAYCVMCPCRTGEADCDSDSECVGSLVCGADNGLRFGFEATWDVCWPAHCQNGVQDADEIGVDCGGSCGCAVSCRPGINGAANFCARCACVAGEGDCDSNAECVGALVCGTDNGARYGFDPTWDVCWPTHCTNGIQDGDETGVDCGGSCGCHGPCKQGQNGGMDYCGLCPCKAGEGDCDSDAQCLGALVCGTDNGARFGFEATWDVCWPAHCNNGVQDGDETDVDCGGSCGCTDACHPGTNGDTDYCVRCGCNSGEGDCDSDEECLGALVCGTDNGPRFGMGDIWDVCWPAHCENGIQDGDEVDVDCGGACGCSDACRKGINGDMNYCARCPCRRGESDCDSDAECAGPLVCGMDNGPLFGFDTIWDVCWPFHCENGVQDGDEIDVDCGGSCGCSELCRLGSNGHRDYCTMCTCVAGEGDCDSDAECLGPLVCGTDNGPRFGFDTIWDVCWPTHCENGVQDGDETGVDCGGSCGCHGPCQQGTLGAMDYCKLCPCKAGEGDCDGHSECVGPLLCGTDNGPRFGYPAFWDICWPAHCENGVQDRNETGIDVGGSCGSAL